MTIRQSVGEVLATAHPGDLVILRLPHEAAPDAHSWLGDLACENPAIRFLILAPDCDAGVIPDPIHAQILTRLTEADADWNEHSGDGQCHPEFLEAMAAAVVEMLSGDLK